MIELIFAKMAAGWVKVLVIVAALMMPVCLVSCVTETVKLHGISVPVPGGFPLYGPWELVHGALLDTKLAQAAQATAERQRDGWKAEYGKMKGGLETCNASVAALGKAGQTWQAAAQAMVDAALKRQRAYLDAMARVNGIAATDAKCPTVDAIFNAGVVK